MPDPILATGLIAKEHIFAVFTDRKESEVLLDPAGIQSQRAEDVAHARRLPGA